MVACGDRETLLRPRNSSEKMSVKSVDLESVLGDVGDVGDLTAGVRWELTVGSGRRIVCCLFSVSCAESEAVEEAGDIHNEGGRPRFGGSPEFAKGGMPFREDLLSADSLDMDGVKPWSLVRRVFRRSEDLVAKGWRDLWELILPSSTERLTGVGEV